ncbi:MAG: hypothetical protein U9R42_06900 [Bacteroidota bacterium]|nr:hypothetical protein [Bacteroidota bacterium]
MFYFKDNVIHQPPFFYIAQLNCNYEFDVIKETGTLLQFTSDFAYGDRIRQDKINEYFKGVRMHKAHSETLSDYFNNEAVKIKSKIGNKKEHRKRDTTDSVAGFINFIVKSITKNECDIVGLELRTIELLLRALDEFFVTVELSTMKIQPNDWRDFGILGYVQPGDKYWTKENRWKNIIKNAGCADYLY